MSRYKVIWKQRLIDQKIGAVIARLFEAGHEVAPLTEAMARIDELLGRQPLQVGESRDAYDRILIVPPIVVEYEVYEEEKVVYVATARYAPKRPR